VTIRRVLAECLDLCRAVGRDDIRAGAQVLLAETELDELGDLPRALALANDALAIYQRLGSAAGVEHTRRIIATIHIAETGHQVVRETRETAAHKCLAR